MHPVCLQYDWKKKFFISIISAAIFFVVASPWTYQFTRKIMPQLASAAGCPTMSGLVVHAGIFFIIIYLIMMPWEPSKACLCKENAVCSQKLRPPGGGYPPKYPPGKANMGKYAKSGYVGM